MTASNDSAWLAKPAAAKLLGVNARTLERHEARGYVEKRTRPRGPLARGNEVEYSRADILALKAGAPNVHAREVGEAAAAAVSNDTGAKALKLAAGPNAQTLVVRQESALAGLLLSAIQTGVLVPSGTVKPWLTLKEASAFSGLPKAWLLAAARHGSHPETTLDKELIDPTGCVVAMNIGSRARAVWMFNREALAK